MEIVRKEAKSSEDALVRCLEELNAVESEVYYYFEDIEGGLLKGKKVVCFAVTKYDVKEYIKDFLSELAYKMGTKFDLEVKESEVGFDVLIVTDDNAALIGKEGRTLNSIQTLLRQSLSKFGRFDIRVNVDVSDYKAKKVRNLKYEVKKLCREVKNSGMDVKLDPMNSYDRRIVHNVVSEFGLVSESVGEEPNRYVVIKRD